MFVIIPTELIVPYNYTYKLDDRIIIPKNIPSVKLTNVSKDLELNKTSPIEILKTEYRKQKLKSDLNKIFTDYMNHEERAIEKEANMRLLHIFYVESLGLAFMIWFIYFR